MTPVACCKHSDGWHGNSGCKFPRCSCTRRILRAGERLTRCSECQRRPDKWGGNHARICSRAGLAPDARESTGKR